MAARRYEISLLVLKHWKRNFVPPRGHAISSISFALTPHSNPSLYFLLTFLCAVHHNLNTWNRQQ